MRKYLSILTLALGCLLAPKQSHTKGSDDGTTQEKITVAIKRLNGDRFDVEVDRGGIVYDLKKAIEQTESIDIAKQRIIYQAKEWDDEEKLSTANITNKSTVHLVVKKSVQSADNGVRKGNLTSEEIPDKIYIEEEKSSSFDQLYANDTYSEDPKSSTSRRGTQTRLILIGLVIFGAVVLLYKMLTKPKARGRQRGTQQGSVR